MQVDQIDFLHIDNWVTKQELEKFMSLKDIKVVFDVGAKYDDWYYQLRPKLTYHLFEPNPKYFQLLQVKLGDKPNVHLNNYGLGNETGEFLYNHSSEGFMQGGDTLYPVKTLDWYIEEYKIKRIDFLKIDTEGYDFKVLQGGGKAIQLSKYIQYEKNSLDDFGTLLKNFTREDIDGNNVFCTKICK